MPRIIKFKAHELVYDPKGKAYDFGLEQRYTSMAEEVAQQKTETAKRAVFKEWCKTEFNGTVCDAGFDEGVAFVAISSTNLGQLKRQLGHSLERVER